MANEDDMEGGVPHGFALHNSPMGQSSNPLVPFAYPESPYPPGTKTASMNYGRDINTLDRSMPLDQADGNPAEAVEGPQFQGTWLGEWGKAR